MIGMTGVWHQGTFDIEDRLPTLPQPEQHSGVRKEMAWQMCGTCVPQAELRSSHRHRPLLSTCQ
eukprot:425662-Rhodomonas_salina.2